MSTPSHAISSAISAVLSMPIRSMSAMVMMLVSRSRATFTASRGTCQPPMPTCTRFLPARSAGSSMEPGRRVHPLVKVLFLDVGVAVEMHDPDLLRGALGDAAHAGKADGMVAADHHRQRAARKTRGHRAADLVEALFEIGGNGEHVARVAQRHLFAQIDGHLVIVGRVKRADLAHACGPNLVPGR
jgi:hypothetical protein